ENEEEEEDDDVDVVYETEEEPKDPQEEQTTTKPSKLAASVDDGTTIFIRNLSFDTDEDSLLEKFSEWGKVRYARIVKDKETGRSRGTAFVCFYEKSSVEECLSTYASATAIYESTSTVPSTTTTSSQSTQQKKSIIVPDASTSPITQKFTLDARFLNITVAVPRTTAEKLTQTNSLTRRKLDKRNLHLLSEGVIFPTSPLAQQIPAGEMSKRMKSYSERKRILKTNPNLSVSKTRVSVRNLEKSVGDSGLKAAARRAVELFWKDVESGKRGFLEGEVVDEMVECGKWKFVDGKLVRKKCVVKSAKVLRDGGGKGGSGGKEGRSKGYGFVEFEGFGDAVACLRYMNGNPDAFFDGPAGGSDAVTEKGKKGKKGKNGKGSVEEKTGGEEGSEKKRKSPIVEFAIENMVVLKQKKEREEKQKEMRKKVEEKKKGGEVSDKSVKSGKRKRDDGKGLEDTVSPKKLKKGAKQSEQVKPTTPKKSQGSKQSEPTTPKKVQGTKPAEQSKQSTPKKPKTVAVPTTPTKLPSKPTPTEKSPSKPNNVKANNDAPKTPTKKEKKLTKRE
ncbi:RNA recognition motif-containing protein, partial [Nowakowskiella sp. JEL0407]